MTRLTSGHLAAASFLLTTILIIGACNNQQAQTVDAPGCRPVPQMTGEKIIAATVEATPQPQIAPGETLSFTFSGNYAIQNNQLVCGFNEVVDYYLSDDELPDFNWEREIVLRLDDRELRREVCNYTCTIAVEIPGDTPPGKHTLQAENIDSVFLMNLEFDLDVTLSTIKRSLKKRLAVIGVG